MKSLAIRSAAALVFMTPAATAAFAQSCECETASRNAPRSQHFEYEYRGANNIGFTDDGLTLKIYRLDEAGVPITQGTITVDRTAQRVSVDGATYAAASPQGRQLLTRAAEMGNAYLGSGNHRRIPFPDTTTVAATSNDLANLPRGDTSALRAPDWLRPSTTPTPSISYYAPSIAEAWNHPEPTPPPPAAAGDTCRRPDVDDEGYNALMGAVQTLQGPENACLGGPFPL